jgi:hypothetical protein
MDLSPVIAWFVPCLGLAASVMVGRRKSKSVSGSIAIPAIFIALFLGVALTFVQVFVHTLCIESLHLCTNRGDGNMSYWFQSFFAVPLFWLSSVVTWRVTG